MAASAEVDLVHLPQEGERLAHAEFARAGHEGADVLRQAAAPEPDPGSQELAPDPLVVPDRFGQRGDVRSGGLAHLRHRIDERDLGGQEGVGRHLHQFGGDQITLDERHASGDLPLVDLPQRRHSAAVDGTDDDSVRGDRVAHGITLPEEFRVPDDVYTRTGRGEPGQPLGDGGRCSHRHGGLAGHHTRSGQVRCERVHCLPDMGEIGSLRTGPLGGADAEEVDIRVGYLCVVAGEVESIGFLHLGQQGSKTGFEEGRSAGSQRGHLFRVGVHRHHIEALPSHRGGMYRTEVPGADD